MTIIKFDDLDAKDWVEFRPGGNHWSNGFRIARPVLETECLVSTCCLKTHQNGEVFTLSLKLHVGVVPTSGHSFSYMSELHGSPWRQEMIAEINAPFHPRLIVLDGIDAFVDGGPMVGKPAEGHVFLAGADRVAIDAVGVPLLKVLGSNDAIMGKKIFDQRQIARAVELALGDLVSRGIELVAMDPDSRDYCDSVREMLDRG